MYDEMPPVELSVSEFVAVLNQTLEYAYPNVVISGELANFRISKNRWVYFDLKDENSSVKFFGVVTQLPGPLEDGMMLKVQGQPRLHNMYGFSVTVQSIQPVGEGSIRKAAELLKAKLAAEGLFDPARKRSLPYPPQRIGLITSAQSAAYADFIKILNARWQGIEIMLCDVQVQGDPAVGQVVAAIEQSNALPEPPEVLVLIRGGGSAEDLAAFSAELVARAVAVSRVPTLVAIGHEVDVSLAELAADRHASTPSNAAELLVPDRQHVLTTLQHARTQLAQFGQRQLEVARTILHDQTAALHEHMQARLTEAATWRETQQTLLEAYNPTAILQRGYALVRREGQIVRAMSQIEQDAIVRIQLSDGEFSAVVQEKEEDAA